MGFLSWIVFGLIAGILAKFLMPGSYDIGLIWTCILGIVGAVVGGVISNFFGKGKVDGFNFGSFVVAVIGAIVVLYLAKNICQLIGNKESINTIKPASAGLLFALTSLSLLFYSHSQGNAFSAPHCAQEPSYSAIFWQPNRVKSQK